MNGRKVKWGKGSNSKVIDGNKIFGEEHTVAYTEVGM